MATVIAEGAVQAGGAIYRLAIQDDMVAELQRRTGWKPRRIFKEMLSGEGDVSLLRLVCHVALKRHHPTASIEVAGEILSEDMAGFGAILTAGAKAFRPKGARPVHGVTFF